MMRREEWRKKFRERRQGGKTETTWDMGGEQSRGGKRKCRRKVLKVEMSHRRGGKGGHRRDDKKCGARV